MECIDARISRLSQGKSRALKPVSHRMHAQKSENECGRVYDTIISMDDCLTVWEQETQLCINNWGTHQYLS